MVSKLIEWALNNPLIVILLAVALAAVGGYAFWNVNVEAYPDPAPAIIEVVAQYPGMSAEEVERQVTIPLEITLAGMPGLKYTRSKSLFGLSHLRNQFEYGVDYNQARQEVINRLQFTQGLPPGVTPQISPTTPTGELMRYTLDTPRDALGRRLYTLNDLKSLQDWTLEREFKRVPRIIDVTSFGGTVKRYEICPDPARLMRYGISLAQLQNAIIGSNGNVGGDYLVQGPVAINVRGVGLLGGGLDPLQQVRALPDAHDATRHLRTAEHERLQELRSIVLTTVNNVPVRVDDVVAGGPQRARKGEPDTEGVLIGHETRLGKVSLSRPRRNAQGEVIHDSQGNVVWEDEEDKVQGIVLMRKNEQTLPALRGVKTKLAELNNTPGRLLPGVQLRPHFDLTGLIEVTTTTVRENLLLGMGLVIVILLMFLSNVRSALIVAINIPLALLFAFAVLYLRGKSANLLSIGAVDFGIIVDSSVIMVENLFRHVSTGENAELPLRERLARASQEIEKSLFFSTAIMVCAFIPLFTMTGPEGQIFGPMADTYAFALGGALLLALTLSPALCLLLFRGLKPARDNFLVRWIRAGYLRQLHWCLEHRGLAVGIVLTLLLATLAALPLLGREFMPELEEGNLYIRGTLPVNVSLEQAATTARRARQLLREYPEVELIQSQVGRPDDGTDPTGFYNVEFSIPLKPASDWPAVNPQTGLPRLWRSSRPRSKPELIADMNAELSRILIGVDWNFSQYIRDNVMESLSGVKGDNSIKIIGPNLDELERLAEQVKNALDSIAGIENVGIFRIMGQPSLELHVNRQRCSQWGILVSDVESMIRTAVGGQAFSQMIEGERAFAITLRWPEPLRNSEMAILNVPVEITNNTVTTGPVPSLPSTPLTGPSTGVSTFGSATLLPAPLGTLVGANVNRLTAVPRLRLKDLVLPGNSEGQPDPGGRFLRSGASTIYREQGNRLIAIKFSVRGRDLAGAVAEAQAKAGPLIQAPYRAEWSGEFQEMQEAEHRLLLVFSVSMVLIVILLYLAFHSFLDAAVVLSNVLGMSLGGFWALLATGINFNISAAVGFISILGVAVMNGLLMVSSFNRLRARGLPLSEALRQGTGTLIRPVTMTALAAIFGLLPAAFSTRIGSQSQRPLAIVVVGGMLATLLLTNLVPVLYSFYGQREPVAGAPGVSH
jgi:cobalt-zinc-cadmium resistance protein CzcA